MAEPRRCDVCGAWYTPQRAPKNGGPGYCSRACNQKAKRERRRPVRQPVVTAPPAVADEPPADATAAIMMAHCAANDLARLSETAPYQLRAPFSRIAEAISRALVAEGL